MLATGALIASLFAVGAGSVSAQPGSTIEAATPDHNPEWGADWSACVGAAGSYDAMFPDVGEDNVHADAINCIAYYGVTVGKLDGTYAPDEHVSAFQMGHFVRAAADLMGADGDAVLREVMLSDTVTRLEMAQLMFGLVDDIDDDVRISPAHGQIESYNHDTNGWEVVNDFFADAKAQVPIFESQLIGASYELGITSGRSANVSTADSVFAPSDPVTRAQMATFISKTLDHSNLRPEGVTIQRNSNRETMVSYRDGDFAPIEDARIDVFAALYADDAFDVDDGECEPRFVTEQAFGTDICEIDISDALTDDEGNVELTLRSDRDPVQVACGVTNGDTDYYAFSTATGSEGFTFWAWTGRLGDEVDEDTALSNLEDVARPVGTAGPDYLRVSGGLPTNDELARMGETVTFTAQLYSEVGPRDGATVVNDVAAGPDRSNNAYLLKIEKYIVTRVASTDSDAGPADPANRGDRAHATDADARGGSASNTAAARFVQAPGDWDLGALIQTPVDTVVFPNADGLISIDLTHLDVNAAPAADNADVGVMFTLRPFTQSPFTPMGTDYIDENLVEDIVAGGNYATATANATYGTDVATGYVIFSDDASDPHNVVGSSAAEYRIIGGGRTGNSVTVTVVDQYGDGMRNVAVSVHSELDTINATAADPDEVVYPEEVDITVQANENRNGDTNLGETATFTRSADRTVYFDFTAGSAGPPLVPSTIVVDDTRAVNRNPDDIGEDDVEGVFRTRRGGTYRIGYTYIGTTAQTEEITPESIEVRRLAINDQNTAADPADDAGSAPTLIAQEVGNAVTVYWARTGVNDQSDTVAAGIPEPVPVLVRDIANRTIVVNEPLEDEAGRSPRDADGDNPRAYFYDEDDTFEINGQGATFEMFEEALGLTTRVNGCQVNMVEWQNYSITRPGRVNRTIWRLTVS